MVGIVPVVNQFPEHRMKSSQSLQKCQAPLCFAVLYLRYLSLPFHIGSLKSKFSYLSGLLSPGYSSADFTGLENHLVLLVSVKHQLPLHFHNPLLQLVHFTTLPVGTIETRDILMASTTLNHTVLLYCHRTTSSFTSILFVLHLLSSYTRRRLALTIAVGA